MNYGLPEDYEKLDRLGISVKGKIVIAKYLHSWRGVKPKIAAEHGAVGCLIYSDPQDDGYARDNVFPQGPMRNPDGVQRGSVMDFASVSPGDPLTPGYRRIARTPRLSRERREEPHQNSRPANFLRRRATSSGRAQRTDGARGVARQSSDFLPRRTRPGQSPS